MRLVKKPTAVNDSTATVSANINTESSPDLTSRQRFLNANLNTCISSPPASLHRVPGVELQYAPAAPRQRPIVGDQDERAARAAIQFEQHIRDAQPG